MIIFLVLTGCAAAEESAQRDTGTIIRLGDAEARGLDPQLVSDSVSIRIASDQFEGLTRFDNEGKAIAGLAESWTISDDGKRWIFQLRPAIKFSDGTPIDGTVFTKALNRIRAEDSGSPHVSLFAIIDRIESANERVIVHLRAPFPQLLDLLAYPAIAALPFHLIEEKGDQWTSVRPLVTSGPYRLINWRLNQAMTLKANPHWFDGRPKSGTVIWQPSDDQQSAMRLLLSGGADVATNFPSNRLAWLTEKYPEYVHKSSSLATYYFVFNTRRPPFDDARVRRALSAAVDRKWIAEKMIAAGNAPAYKLVPHALLAPDKNTDAAEQKRSQRLVFAKSLLKEAGYGPKRPLDFEMRFNSSAEHRRVAAAMAAMWREIGVEARLLNSEASLHFDAMRRGDFDIARSGWIADLPAPENFLAIHRIDAGLQNYAGYANPDYDKALDIALMEADPKIREQKMQAAEAILMSDMPILPLYFYTSKALVAPNISGWKDNIANVHPSHYLARQTR